jgi:hypothetical protein
VAVVLPWSACAVIAATVEELVAMALVAIASGAVESPLEAGVAGLVVVLVFTSGATTGIVVCAASTPVGSCAVESVCAEVSSVDLLDDLPVDLSSPVCPLPDVVVEAAAPPVLAGLLPEALVGWFGAVVLSELEFEVVCVLDEVSDVLELFVWDCGGELAGAWGAGAGCGAVDWEPMALPAELLSISEAKLSEAAEADASGRTFCGALSGALAVASNVTLTTT